MKRVEELADALKPWIGPEKMSDAEREGLVRRMLGELTLLSHFAEARRGVDDGRWREERAERLAKAVEAVSGGRIAGEYAETLAKLVIRYAERRDERTKQRIENLAERVGVPEKEVWDIVERVLSGEYPYAYCLARDCARDEVVRKFVEPALELIMLEKALRGEFDREKALLIFGQMFATAIAGDGTVGYRRVGLTVGGELGGGAALLRLATLLLLKELLPDELKFDVRIYVDKGVYHIAAYGEDAARLMRLLAASAPSAGGEYLSPKFDRFVEEARVEVRVDNIRQIEGGAAADLIISGGGVAVKYDLYLRKDHISLRLESADRSHAELAARLLRHAGVSVEVKKRKKRKVWYVDVATDKLAAGRKELRDAVRKVVEEALKENWVDKKKAERWLKKLEGGRVLMEGWPKYKVGLTGGALDVRFASTNSGNIEQVAQRLEEMGLERGVYFTVKIPKEGREGYVRIHKMGLAYAAWLSVNSENENQRKLAADFVELILRRAEEADGGMCGKVCEKVEEIVEKGKSWGSQKLERFEKEFEVNGKKYKVKVIGGEAVEEGGSGRKLLRLKITAEVNGVKSDYTITYGRRGRINAAVGYAYARADAPGGKEADAERFSALVEALTGKKPTIRRRKDGRIKIECYEGHLEGFMLYKEFFGTIMQWLKNTSRRGRDTDRQEARGLP